MSIASVKTEADKLASEQLSKARALLPPLIGATIKPNVKLFRRLAGLRGGDLDTKQDERYDENGKRVRK